MLCHFIFTPTSVSRHVRVCVCVWNVPFPCDFFRGLCLYNLLCHKLTHPLVQISSKHCQSQTGRARELKFSENVHPTLCVTCHTSHVTCHVSYVTCHTPVDFQLTVGFAPCVHCHLFGSGTSLLRLCLFCCFWLCSYSFSPS